MKRYNKSISRALAHLYPGIGLKFHKMLSLEGITILIHFTPFPLFLNKFLFNFNIILLVSRWSEAEYRRRFFVSFAEQNAFDPLIPENWYGIAKTTLLLHKVSFTSPSIAKMKKDRKEEKRSQII